MLQLMDPVKTAQAQSKVNEIINENQIPVIAHVGESIEMIQGDVYIYDGRKDNYKRYTTKIRRFTIEKVFLFEIDGDSKTIGQTYLLRPLMNRDVTHTECVWLSGYMNYEEGYFRSLNLCSDAPRSMKKIEFKKIDPSFVPKRMSGNIDRRKQHRR